MAEILTVDQWKNNLRLAMSSDPFHGGETSPGAVIRLGEHDAALRAALASQPVDRAPTAKPIIGGGTDGEPSYIATIGRHGDPTLPPGVVAGPTGAVSSTPPADEAEVGR